MPGDPIPSLDEPLERIAADGPPSRADSRQLLRNKALDLLARREHSVAELHRKLHAYVDGGNRGRARGGAMRPRPDPESIDEVLNDLQNEGLVSDARFTEAFVRYRANNGYGPQRIQAELRERGVSEKMQAAYLDFGDPQWFERAMKARCKRFGEGNPKDFKERARQARFLQYRGFTTDQAREALDGDVAD